MGRLEAVVQAITTMDCLGGRRVLVANLHVKELFRLLTIAARAWNKGEMPEDEI